MEEENKIKVQDNTQPEPETPSEPTPEPSTPESAPAEPSLSTEPPLAAESAPTSDEIIKAFEQPGTTEAKPTEQPNNFKKQVVLAVILGLLLIGNIVAYFLTSNRSKCDTSSRQQNSEQSAIPIEQTSYNPLALKGNDLSDFDLAFLRLENKQENIIYSPLSMKYALAMLADASAGNTKSQITALIGDYTPKAYLNSANRSLANAMFIRNDFAPQVKSTYTDTLASKYNASVILDPFTSPDNANKWVEDKTLGIIKNTFNENTVNPNLDYMLVNALAIDMQWNNRIQCAESETWQTDNIKNIYYSVRYAHENYNDSVSCRRDSFETANFNGKEDAEVAKIGGSANRYDIISELGETHIRETVQAEYDKWLAEIQADTERAKYANTDFNLDDYISELASNYGRNNVSTDFYFLDGEAEKIFAKDLQEYDGSTLQYVGIMPKSDSLNAYINSLTAEKATSLIANLKDPSNIESFKEGVVTKLSGYVPFFKFDFTMDDFLPHLQELGITDVFSSEDADLSNMIDFDTSLANKPYISTAIHKADIDFSNDGIKAAAVTAFGGMGAASDAFEYKWDVPVEEIDLTFDKPFLFLIRDKTTGEIWFTGTVYKGNIKE
ncbi:hypothetical protein IKE71_04350 [Candidatus Saccharibacteria bacterium]|nr:hypothetical protein [Candidatus Saccharibacteria bacterium]